MTFVLLGVGLVLLMAGGSLLVKGASDTALALGVSPLMIGVNWVMLGYSAGVIANHLMGQAHSLLRGLFAALLMVALDVLIEPVAIRYGFWSWEGDVVPLRNYLGWFLVAFPLQSLFAFWLAEVRNKVAIALFILQILFFLILGITLM